MVTKPLTLPGAHSSAWIEWLPAEQLVEGSSPSGPVPISMLFSGVLLKKGKRVVVQQKLNDLCIQN